MKKTSYTAFAIMTLSVVFIACNSEETVRVESVSLPTSALLHVDSILDITATIRPFAATNRTVTWTSSNNIVATVAETSNPLVGRVTANEVGETVITVTTQDGNHTSVSTVIVTMPAIGQGCNGYLPGWGVSLGTVSFATNQEWTVGNQIWSDAVTATACQKETFAGESPSLSFNADCRSNPDFPGDLFSWCAVVRFQNLLCPAPWRVPTGQDFIDLDIALGGTGDARTDIEFVNNNYINPAIWGGSFSGATSRSSGTLSGQGIQSSYWSSTDVSYSSASAPGSDSTGRIFLNPGSVNKSFGLALRCIRDNN